MEDYKIKANEQFFSNILNVLTEGGKYMFPKAMQIYTKENNKLVGSTESMVHIKDIVSDKFFNNHFETKN
jgi:hypothetical protein